MPATLPYAYDFEVAAEWGNWQTASNNTVNWYRGIVSNGNSSNTMYLSADNGATNSWTRNVITNVAAYRDIDFGTDTHSYTLNFSYRGGGHLTSVYDGVAVLLVDPATVVDIPNTYLGSPWGQIHIVHARGDSVWSTHTLQFDHISGVKRLVFYHFNNAATSGYMDIPPAIDDISVEVQLCERPYDLTSTAATDHSVTLQWNGDDTAIYVIDYRPAGTTGTDIFDTVVGLSHTVSGLSANTSYNFWVKKRCDDTTYSNWTSNITVRTLCGYETLPFNEDFESYTGSTYSTAGILPACWEGYTNGTSDVYSPHITGSGSYSYPHSGSKCLTMTSSGSTATYGTTKVVALPPFNVPLNQLAMSFWYRMESATQGTLTVGYVTDVNNLDSSFVAVKTMVGTATLTQDTVFFDSILAVNGQIAFRWYKESTFYSVGIDDIAVWSSIVECVTPILSVDTVGETMATITWSPTAAASYEVAAVQDAWLEPANSATVTGTSYTFTGLQDNTNYILAVRSVCGTNYYSEWDTIMITTLRHPCAMPTGVTVTNPTYSGATVSWNAGEDETAWEVNVSCSSPVYDHTYTVNDTPTVEVTGLDNGITYKVIVRALCDADWYSPWTDTVDLTTTTCPIVTGVSASGISATSATISWNSTGALSYEVEYGDMGFHTGDGHTVTSTTNSVEINQYLEEQSTYDVFVRSVCADGVYSGWSEKYTFRTTAVGIEEVVNGNVVLYPNPASTMVTIRGIEGESTVTVVDLNGREVYKNTANSDLTIDLTGYAKGAYFVRITGESTTAIRKLIVK